MVMRGACERGWASGKGSEQTWQKVRAPIGPGDTTWACSVNGGGGGVQVGIDPNVEK